MPAQAPAPMNMPIPKNKKQIVGKTPAPQKYEESTVKDCMFWPQNDPKLKGKGKKAKENDKSQESDAGRPEYSSFIHGKAEVGKARTWGFDLHTPPPPERKDDETAIRALRGWSDAFPGEEFKEEVKQSNTEETKEFAMYKDEQGRVQSKKKSNKKGKKEEGKKGLMAIYDDDVHVADVLSYRFGNEEAQRRQRQQERERAKRDQAAADAANAAKAVRKVKHTQASIARTNRNIEKCTKVEQDLWKMSKFTKNAQPAIDTNRTKPFSHHNGYTRTDNAESDAIAIKSECRQNHVDYADLQSDLAEVNINTEAYTGDRQLLNEGPYEMNPDDTRWDANYSECKGLTFADH